MKSQTLSSRPLSNPAFVHAVMAVALAVACLAVAPRADAKSEEVARAPSGVMYVSGGIGTNAVELLKSMEKDFNLKIVFANKAGEFLSDVKVTVTDSGGRVLLDTVTEGPLFMAKLPVGGYHIDATFDGRPERQNVAVTANKLTSVGFQWAAR
ncbi:MAG: hypothetical protein ABI724_06285 [Betaproteobacteria bacterium]